jgi:hypothetical protein
MATAVCGSANEQLRAIVEVIQRELLRGDSRRLYRTKPAPHFSVLTSHQSRWFLGRAVFFLVSRSTEFEKCTRSVDFLQFQNFRASNRSLAICTKTCNLQNDYR